tara:strand:- start:719 stop:1132 length:414 start_codon:yes stop_codon:yes gene_type:complete
LFLLRDIEEFILCFDFPFPNLTPIPNGLSYIAELLSGLMGVFFYFQRGAFKLEKYIQSINAISIQRNIFYSKYLYTGESIMQPKYMSSYDIATINVLNKELTAPSISPTYRQELEYRLKELNEERPLPPKTESNSLP